MEDLRMASVTIRNLDLDTKQKLREQAARHGNSMEEELRTIVRAAVNDNPQTKKTMENHESVWDIFLELRKKYGTFELELPKRSTLADSPPSFE
jgi:antitoxin FitA